MATEDLKNLAHLQVVTPVATDYEGPKKKTVEKGDLSHTVTTSCRLQ
jgi:hypothetical protein